jgi:hypothetical protein
VWNSRYSHSWAKEWPPKEGVKLPMNLKPSNVIIAACLATCCGAWLYAQPVPSATTGDGLLSEVKALRADVNRAASATLRAQIVVGRISIQEQRVSAITRQLTDLHARIAASIRTQADGSQTLRENSSQGRQKYDDLRTQEAALLKTLGEEQARWSSFNAQLDELERAANGPPAR